MQKFACFDKRFAKNARKMTNALKLLQKVPNYAHARP